MKILKFGGTSLATPDRIRTVLRLVREGLRDDTVAVVVSAFAGVTNRLAAAAAVTTRGGVEHAAACEEIAWRHQEAVEVLASDEERNRLRQQVGEGVAELRDLFRGASLVHECTDRTLDSILSHGERLCAPIVAAALRHAGIPAEACDARPLILTDDRFGRARVKQRETEERIRTHFAGRKEIQVVTGFIGSNGAGETTTLGRGGSDYTASLIGAALGASCIEIWTDVDGVMSADPRQVPGAFSIDALSYDELMELAHFGAKVVYPPTVHPARSRSIPLVIRNTLNPTFPGTRITRDGGNAAGGIRGIASIGRVALLRLEGDGMVGVPGIAKRLFGALAAEGTSVILISQASSEHSICFAVDPASIAAARSRIGAEFALERQAGLIDDLVVEEDVSLIAAVGAGMRDCPGLAGRLFGVLGGHGINVRAITQGSSELNITLATSARDEGRALQAIHDAFFFPGRRIVPLHLVGAGRVGSALIDQIRSRAEALEREEGIRLVLASVATSRGMLVDEGGIDLSLWKDRLGKEGRPTRLADLVGGIVSRRRPGSVFIDCTSGDDAPGFYPSLLGAGVAVVAANKRPFSGPMEAYRALKRAARDRGVGLHHETTVGAGLPILGTLANLVRTGDRIERIEGVLSGSIGFILGRLASGSGLSEAVREAQALGLTEPDPREDLSGADVARKLLILAREVGLALEPADVRVQPLLPGDGWEGMPLPEFWKAVAALDSPFLERVRRAGESGRRLVYLAVVEKGAARVGLEEVGSDHPAATLRGPENLIAFTTDRYADAPLVVRGPGAGPEVTAAGVFGDILIAAAAAAT